MLESCESFVGLCTELRAAEAASMNPSGRGGPLPPALLFAAAVWGIL